MNDCMTSFSIQALHWTTDGELIPCDRLVLLNTLIRDSLPDVQLELIRVVEELAVAERRVTPQVSSEMP